MYAHKIQVTIPDDHEVRFRVPQDFPAGKAEVIVLAERQSPLKAASSGRGVAADPLAKLLAKFPAAGTLGPAVFREDPTLPLDPDAWPSDLKP